ncbi:MAG TPA: hypothetical protein PKE55_09560 [Kiritimatiellia bacterium]|nr:hypothetical protein [Kiritimatiellia bacterium]
MFKTVGQDVWAFDLEWVPDPRAGRVLYGLPESMPDAEVMAEMWVRNGATEENPMPFLKLVMCRVVSIAAVQRKVRNGEVSLNLLWLPRDANDPAQQSEKGMLEKFLGAVGKFHPQLVGFNSMNSDLRILIQRGMVLGVQAAGICQRPDKPWEGYDYFSKSSEAHIDLLEVAGGWGKAGMSLHELATLSGIPGKLGTSGDDVATMWLKGQWKEIVQYNCADALTTYLVWLRMAFFGGKFTREEYGEEQERVRELIMELAEQPEHEFLTEYFEEWERLLQATGHYEDG